MSEDINLTGTSSTTSQIGTFDSNNSNNVTDSKMSILDGTFFAAQVCSKSTDTKVVVQKMFTKLC